MAKESAKRGYFAKPYRLSDTFGLQVMVAALSELVEFEITRHSGCASQDKFLELEIKLRRYSSLLCVPEAARDISQIVTIQDFQFHPAELFKYQKLVFFVSTERPDEWPLVDRETPIALNKDLGGANFLFELAGDWIAWLGDKDSTPGPSDPSRYCSDVKFGLFQHFTRDLWGGQSRKYGPRWIDSTHDAARYAICLMGEGHSENAAAITALEKYPRLQSARAKEFNFGYVVSSADDNGIDSHGAKSKVIREIRRIKKEEW